MRPLKAAALDLDGSHTYSGRNYEKPSGQMWGRLTEPDTRVQAPRSKPQITWTA